LISHGRGVISRHTMEADPTSHDASSASISTVDALSTERDQSLDSVHTKIRVSAQEIADAIASSFKVTINSTGEINGHLLYFETLTQRIAIDFRNGALRFFNLGTGLLSSEIDIELGSKDALHESIDRGINNKTFKKRR
jgi:hypothetical protein